MKNWCKSMLLITVALATQPSMANALLFKCNNHQGREVLELVIGPSKNHLLFTQQEAPLKKGESATWKTAGFNDFVEKNIVSSQRRITMRGEISGSDSIKLYMGFYLDPACPSCESGHGSSNNFQCKLAGKTTVDAKNYFEYKREAHYPNGHEFQWSMREVAEDFWGPRQQITWVDPIANEFLVINFDDGRIWLHGYTKSSGSNDFMEKLIHSFLKRKPLLLEEATTQAGKCQFDAMMKHQYPNQQCKKFLQ